MTRRRINTRDARLGMFLDSIDGDWSSHPFWRTGFVLSSPSDLQKLRDSGVTTVVIDESRSIALASPVPRQTAAQPGGRVAEPQRVPLTAQDRQMMRSEQSLLLCRRAIGRIFAEARSGRVISPDGVAKVSAEIARSMEECPEAFLGITRLKSVDSYTYVHSIAVSALMIGFGRHLDFDDKTVQLVGLAGLMHDVGKVFISPAILGKPGALTTEEIEVIRTHPAAGHRIVEQNDFPAVVLDVALHHHEKIDGTGYPNGVVPELSSYARMAAICDVYDAMTSIRPYKRAWTPIEALNQMARWKGHFDPVYFASFLAWIGQDEAVFIDPKEPTPAFAVNGFSDPAGDLNPKITC